MPADAVSSALLTVALAAVIGVFAQVMAAWWRMPAIVLLLVFGVVFGRSGLGWIDPDTIGAGLSVLVKLAVAVILFDGALNLRLEDLRRTAREVRRLVTVGVLITGTAATLVAYFLTGLQWKTAIVFGALVTVTGPTVVQPLLKRIDLPRRVRATLEGEAILIDPIGAILAVTLFDILLDVEVFRGTGLLTGALSYVSRIGVGVVVGVPAGIVLSWLLRQRRVVPAELVNVVALAGVWGAFGLAEYVQPEAGIMSVVALGLAIQRDVIPEERRLRQFKEQLTVLGIGLLFVLLAADLPLALLRNEGWRGVSMVLVLMLLVRPLNVFTSLRGSSLNWRERVFVAWIGPRGIVAASVASLFALRLTELASPDATRLLALTFLTIAMTVTIQGLTAPLAARVLSLHATGGKPAIVVGAGPLGLTVARVLADAGRPVALIDRNPAYIRRARRAGLEALRGNALEEALLQEAGGDDAELLVAVTTNSEVNALAAQLARDRFGIPQAYTALGQPERGATQETVAYSGARLAFGRPLDVRYWDAAIENGAVELKWVTLPDDWPGRPVSELAHPDSLLAIARRRGNNVELTHTAQRWTHGDTIAVITKLDAQEVLQALAPTSQTAPTG